MKIEKYNEIAKSVEPKKPVLKNCIMAFISGGIIAVIGQFLLEFYMNIYNIGQSDATVYMIVTLVIVAGLLTGVGVFDKIAVHTGAGTFIPITGFANAMSSAALESKPEGLVQGIGSNMFKYAGSVITFGIFSAFIFGVIRYVFHI